MRARFVALAGLVLVLVLIPNARAQGRPVVLAEIDSEITRATVEYVRAAIEHAEFEDARALVFRFDTPGGGLQETQEIQRMFLATRIPILGWVAPAGTNAWSAGTILLESTDFAAMAPFTVIGSVQPVVITGGGFEPVTDAKIINALVASLQETLRLHARNETLASAFIRENLNLNANEALAAGATEAVAATIGDVLLAADGFALPAPLLGQAPGKPSTLDLAGATVEMFAEPFGVALLGIFANPVVSGLLLLLGIYAVVFGLSAPGHGAEIAGIVMIALGVLGLGFSVSVVGIFLVLLGIVFLIVEIKTPGFGVFGIAGIVCIVLGTVFLAPVAPPRFLLSRDAQLGILAALLTPTLGFGVFLLLALYKVIEVRRQKPVTGRLIGEEADAVDPIPVGGRGYVRFHGELWLATSSEEIAPGERVVITAKEGVALVVERKDAPLEGPAPAGEGTGTA